MLKKEVVDYIREGLNRGFKLEDIKKRLIDAGHSRDNVDDAIAAVKKENNLTNNTTNIKVFHNKPIFFITIIILVIIIILSSLLLIFDFRGFKLFKEKSVDNSLAASISLPVSEDNDVNEMMYNAIKNGNIELCKKILIDNLIAKCEDNFYYSEGIRIKDKKTCEKIKSDSELRLKCVNSLSMQEAVENNDCTSFSGEQKKECEKIMLVNTALAKDDINWCKDNIRCRDTFYFMKSVNSRAITLCDEIIDNGIKLDCENNLK